MRTLLRNGRVRVGWSQVDEWLLIDGPIVAATGSGEPPAADHVVDLDGGTLLPAFCDPHVHLPATGLYASGLDLRGEKSAAAILAAFAERRAQPGAILFGGNFEDPLDAPLDRHDLDRAVGERAALLARADMHSCIVSTALLDALDLAGLEGVDRDDAGAPTGYLREKAAAEAWRAFEAGLDRGQLTAAVRDALELAASRGVAYAHEMFVVEWRGWDSLEWFLGAIADSGVEVTTYVADMDVKRVRDLGFSQVGGDLFLDGSFGSHTAWMSDPYDPAPPMGVPATGISYRDDDDLFDFFLDAQRLDMQVGVHAIGDAAIEQAISTWERVAGMVGVDKVRSLGHRIEHFECASDDHIARCLRLKLMASVQPAFDLYWGGSDGLYARRIGWERAKQMNRFATMYEAGLLMGAGSDSTVTPLDPMLQMRALRSHHVAEESLDPHIALDMVTIGGHTLARRDSDHGMLSPQSAADIAWLTGDPLTTAPERLEDIETLGTWRLGRRIWPAAEMTS